MSVLRTPPSNGGINTPSTPSVQNKRLASDLTDTSPPIDAQINAKKANVEKLPTRDSEAQDKQLTMATKAKTKSVTPGIVSKENKNPDDNTKTLFNVTTSNKFSELSINDSSNTNTAKNTNSADSNKKLNKKRIPPITIVGAVNFTKAINIVSEIAKDNYCLKYMSVGVKIQIDNVENYSEIKSKLLANKIEFYSHDVNPDKFEQYVLSGINKTDTNELMNELTSKGFDVTSINEILLNKPRFNEEGLYRVTFKGPVDQAKLLRTRLNHTIVKWKKSERKNKLTQCRRCQKFGHGMRNCNIAFKCSKCGDNHESSTCTATVTKCANCEGDHAAQDATCPQRKKFIEMRQKMSAKGNHRATSITKKPPRFENAKEFPQLPSKNQWTLKKNPIFNEFENPHSTQIRAEIATNTVNTDITPNDPRHPFVYIHEKPEAHPSWKLSCGNLFSAHQCSVIFKELTLKLRSCMNKQEQLEVMFELATKYLYDGTP